jgi:hypothetical protein
MPRFLQDFEILKGQSDGLIAPRLTLACAGSARVATAVCGSKPRTRMPPLTDLRSFLTASYPKHSNYKGTVQCQAVFYPPPETRRERPTW